MVLFSSFVIGGIVFLAVPATLSALARLGDSDAVGTHRVWTALLAISLIGTIVAHFLFTPGIARITASSAAVITTIEPA